MTQDSKATNQPASEEEVVADAVGTQNAPETTTQDLDSEQPRQVPLKALEAERRKRQDLEAQNKILQDMIRDKEAQKAPPEPPEDLEEFATRGEVRRYLEQQKHIQKREVLEEAYKEMNPAAIDQINANLEEILKKKPWLAQSIEAAPNRYARAYEIVQDYTPKPVDNIANNAKRIAQNAVKPGNPASIAKPAQSSKADYLRSIAGKQEFREYRKNVVRQG